MASSTTYKYVVIGAGNAAGYIARHFTLADIAPNSLCLIGDEPVLPYERPALSKAVLINDKLRLPGFHTSVGGGGDRQTDQWYSDHSITTLLSSPVTSIDAASKTATLASGDSITASDALILATGAVPIRLTRTPGHDLDGIFYLRNNADAIALYDGLQAANGKNVVIIGGGYIGMEVAAAASIVGCNVTLVFPEDHMMFRLFTPEIAEYYENLYASKGIKFEKKGALAQQFISNDGHTVSALRVKRDELEFDVPADLIVVGVGARPETSLLKNQVKLDQRGGIIVDGSLQTSVPGVYAIGDIATFPLKMYDGRHARMEHVQNARDMAAHVVSVITSNNTTGDYDYLPYFYSRVFHMSWQFFGDSDNPKDILVIGVMDQTVLDTWTSDTKGQHPQLLTVWTGQGNVVQGIFMESPSDNDTQNMKKIARQRPTVDPVKLNACPTVEDAWAVLNAAASKL